MADPPDVNALVRQSVANFEKSRRAGLQWQYTQTDTTVAANSKTTEVSEVTPLLGTPYERLVAKNGHPLSPEERRKEEEKFQKTLQRRQNESSQERAARLRKYESDWSFLKDLPNAYTYKLVGEEAVNARPAWLVQMTPRPDFRPVTSRGAMLKHIEGRLWIDKAEVQWARADAHVIDPISIGWIIARIGAGADIHLDFERVAEGVWLPQDIDINGSARIMMVHRKDLKEHVAFSRYSRAEEPLAVQVTGTPAKKKPLTKRSFR